MASNATTPQVNGEREPEWPSELDTTNNSASDSTVILTLHPDGDAHRDADGDTDRHADGHTDEHAHHLSDEHAHGDTHGRSDPDRDTST